jgi:hypothetical protein
MVLLIPSKDLSDLKPSLSERSVCFAGNIHVTHMLVVAMFSLQNWQACQVTAAIRTEQWSII